MSDLIDDPGESQGLADLHPPPTEFLLARIAEDEGDARAMAGLHPDGSDDFDADTDGYAVSGRMTKVAQRVLARCAADRRIVALHPIDTYLEWCPTCFSGDFDRLDEPEHEDWPCPTLRALASVYADHPDYQQEWAL